MIAAIFDIDGTLLQSFGFDRDYYARAVKEVLGEVSIHEDWGDYEKVTDPGILLQIMEENSVYDKSCVQKVRAGFTRMIRSYLRNGGKCCMTKGVPEFIDGLCADSRFKVGIATGGWGSTAKLKLRHAGFGWEGMGFTSGDDGDGRTDIMKKCLDSFGNSFEKTVYFGDAEWDMNASRELGWDFVGVGKRLKGKCDVWIEDFSDRDAVYQLCE